MEGRGVLPQIHAHLAVPVGQETEVAGRAPRVGLRDRAEWGKRLVGRHPANAGPDPLLQLRIRYRAPPQKPGDVGVQEPDEPLAAHQPASRSGVPLSQ